MAGRTTTRKRTGQQVETSKGYREQAYQDKRKPNDHPAFEHGAGEVICQPVEKPYTPIIAIIKRIVPQVPSRRRRQSGLK